MAMSYPESQSQATLGSLLRIALTRIEHAKRRQPLLHTNNKGTQLRTFSFQMLSTCIVSSCFAKVTGNHSPKTRHLSRKIIVARAPLVDSSSPSGPLEIRPRRFPEKKKCQTWSSVIQKNQEKNHPSSTTSQNRISVMQMPSFTIFHRLIHIFLFTRLKSAIRQWFQQKEPNGFINTYMNWYPLHLESTPKIYKSTPY